MRLLLVLVLATSPVFAQPIRSPEPEAPIRIMPIGDSITEGNDGGFRIPLIRLVSEAFEMPDLVGRRSSREADNGVGYDHDQDGYSAYRIDEIASGEGFWDAPPIEQRLDDWDPAVVLLHAGTNDAQQNYYPYGNRSRGIPNVVQRLDDLISRIVAHSPHVYVIVAQINPANPPASQTTINYIKGLNQRIPRLVAQHQALGHRVSLVDMYTPMLAFPTPTASTPAWRGSSRWPRCGSRGSGTSASSTARSRTPSPAATTAYPRGLLQHVLPASVEAVEPEPHPRGRPHV